MAGVLYVVATPIGNLSDLSPRAVEVLGQVGAVVAEDTRRSGTLLRGLPARPRLISLPGEQEERRIPLVLEQLQLHDVALVSDAGTPAISDPGRRLVAAAEMPASKWWRCPVPRPSRQPSRPAAFEQIASFSWDSCPAPSRETSACCRPQPAGHWCSTSPHRLAATLEWAAEVVGERRVAVAREISKLHESWYLGTAAELAAQFRADPPRGECTVVVEAPPTKRSGEDG